MFLERRDCVQYDDGEVQCYDDDSFWYSDKGVIVKWVILALIVIIFFGWFLGGYMHAKRRLKKGQPLLAYHRFLVSYSDRRRYGQAGLPPQNHFTFYQPQAHPYHPNNAPYQQRQDGAWAEPPPLYENNDAPPQYFAPPGASKMHPNQGGTGAMEMPRYGAPQPGLQQSGVVGGNTGDLEQGQTHEMPPRPQAAKAKVMGFVERFRR